MTQDEINFVEELLKAPLRKLRKMANDRDKECTRNELVVMIIENELFVDETIDDSFRGGYRDVCSNMLPYNVDNFRKKYENKEIE